MAVPVRLSASLPLLALAAVWAGQGALLAGSSSPAFGVGSLAMAVACAFGASRAIGRRASPTAAGLLSGLIALAATAPLPALLVGWPPGSAIVADPGLPLGLAILCGGLLTMVHAWAVLSAPTTAAPPIWARAAAALGALALSGGLVVSAGSAEPGACSDVAVLPAATANVAAEAIVDGRSIGRATVAGSRIGTDVDWSVGEPSAVTARDSTTTTWALDLAVLEQIGRQPRATIEDFGVVREGTTHLRRCRALVNGPDAVGAFAPLGWFLDEPPSTDPRALPVWRGNLEWWLDEGVLVRATVDIGGLPADAWPARSDLRRATSATLRAELRLEPLP